MGFKREGRTPSPVLAQHVNRSYQRYELIRTQAVYAILCDGTAVTEKRTSAVTNMVPQYQPMIFTFLGTAERKKKILEAMHPTSNFEIVNLLSHT